MFSDLFFDNPALRTAELVAEQSDVYSYQYTHQEWKCEKKRGQEYRCKPYWATVETDMKRDKCSEGRGWLERSSTA